MAESNNIEGYKNKTTALTQNYISKVFVNTRNNDDDVIQISTERLTDEGDIFVVDERVLSPSLVKTQTSIDELKPEVSNAYPFKITTPVDEADSTIILSPRIDTPVTASQNYYVPIYFERYDIDTIRLIDRSFTELTLPTES